MGERYEEVTICRCEEVTRAEIEAAIADGCTTLNEVKRYTHAGAGLCQGRTCRHLITGMLCQATGLDPTAVGRDTVRVPLEPIQLSKFEPE